jgi:hypothetical protein
MRASFVPVVNPKALTLQTQDLSQKQEKDGWTKPTHTP